MEKKMNEREMKLLSFKAFSDEDLQKLREAIELRFDRVMRRILTGHKRHVILTHLEQQKVKKNGRHV